MLVIMLPCFVLSSVRVLSAYAVVHFVAHSPVAWIGRFGSPFLRDPLMLYSGPEINQSERTLKNNPTDMMPMSKISLFFQLNHLA